MLGLCLGLPLGFMYLFIKLFQLITNRHITRNRLLLILGAMGIAYWQRKSPRPKSGIYFSTMMKSSGFAIGAQHMRGKKVDMQAIMEQQHFFI